MTALILPGAPDTAHAAGDPSSFVAVSANLLPDEIVATRRLRLVRRRVLAGLVALLVLIGGGYAAVTWQTHQARNDLADAQRETATLQHQQQQFAPLVKVQTHAAAIERALHDVMAGDVQWTTLLTALRTRAGTGIHLTTITANVSAGAATPASSAGGTSVLNQTGKPQVGTIDIAGAAPDKRAVAAYVDALATVRGLAVPYPASVSTAASDVTFSLSVIITADAPGGRFATQPARGGR